MKTLYSLQNGNHAKSKTTFQICPIIYVLRVMTFVQKLGEIIVFLFVCLWAGQEDRLLQKAVDKIV